MSDTPDKPAKTDQPNAAPAPPAPPATLATKVGPLDLSRAWQRLTLTLVVGVVAAFAVGDLGVRHRLVIGWDAAAVLHLAISWYFLLRSDAADTALRAGKEDPGRWLIAIITVLAGLFSFGTAVSLLADHDRASLGWMVATLGTVGSSWAVMHTNWTFRYAHLYYASDADKRPLDFPGDAAPCDMDFAYFAFTVGMTFQVSDVQIKTAQMRRTTLFHALLSFVYYTVIIAVAINLATG